jgi:hypothetical protein
MVIIVHVLVRQVVLSVHDILKISASKRVMQSIRIVRLIKETLPFNIRSHACSLFTVKNMICSNI